MIELASLRRHPGLQLCSQRGAIDLGGVNVNRGDPTRVRDVVDRICVEHEEIGASSGRQAAHRVETEKFGAPARRGNDSLSWRHSCLYHRFKLTVCGQAEEMVLQTGVGAKDDPSARGVELGQAAFQDCVALFAGRDLRYFPRPGWTPPPARGTLMH